MEDIKKLEVGDNGNGLEEKPEEKKEEPKPPTDFKIAEIWIRSGQLRLEASREFWLDKFRARGILKYCDDIVKDAEWRDDRIVKPSSWNNFKNFIRGIKRRK